MNVIIYDDVEITGTKYNIRCIKCGHTWGVYLLESGVGVSFFL